MPSVPNNKSIITLQAICIKYTHILFSSSSSFFCEHLKKESTHKSSGIQLRQQYHMKYTEKKRKKFARIVSEEMKKKKKQNKSTSTQRPP